MSIIKQSVERSVFLRRIKYRFLHWLHFLDYLIRRDERERKMVSTANLPFLGSEDDSLIPRVSDAGSIRKGRLMMHNGIQVLSTAYNGYANSKIISAARGVHEPQEERIFQDVLPHVVPGSWIIELGSFWAFYSIWYLKAVSSGKALCVEPVLSHLNYTREHMRLNGTEAECLQAMVGDEYIPGEVPTVSVDYLVDGFGISRVGILHSDIQGHELNMLRGASKAFSDRIVDFVFISTHSEDLHVECRSELRARKMEVIADISLAESWTPDGFLVAKRSEMMEIPLKPPFPR